MFSNAGIVISILSFLENFQKLLKNLHRGCFVYFVAIAEGFELDEKEEHRDWVQAFWYYRMHLSNHSVFPFC